MKFPVLSYTLLNTWDICPHQAARRYILRDLPKEEPTPQMQRGIDVHNAVEKRVRNKTPLPADMPYEALVSPLDRTRVEPEMELAITEAGRPVGFWDDNAWLRVKLDAPLLMRTDSALLVDWKTGKQREEPFELEVGALLLQAKRPEINTMLGCYIWLKDGVRGPTHDLSNTARTWGFVQQKANEIATAVEHCRFEKTPGPLCGWCPVMDCQHNRRAK